MGYAVLERIIRLSPRVLYFLFIIGLAESYAEGEQMEVKTAASELRVFVEGNKIGQTVLLIHGGPGVPDYLQPVASILNANFRTIRFDQRGVGGSVALAGTYDIDGYINDIDAILKAVGVERVHLFGHSWGGMLAQIYAAYRPNKVKSMFLSSPSSGTGEIWKQMEKEVMAYNRRQATTFQWLGMGLDSLLGMMGSNRAYQMMFSKVWRYYFKNPNQAPPADETWLSGIRAKAINSTRRSIIEMNDLELLTKLSKLNIPVLILYGGYDIYGDSAKLSKDRWPRAEHIILKNAGHLPWIQDQQEFIRVLNGFYSKQ